jgi:hypothetical protein
MDASQRRRCPDGSDWFPRSPCPTCKTGEVKSHPIGAPKAAGVVAVDSDSANLTGRQRNENGPSGSSG